MDRRRSVWRYLDELIELIIIKLAWFITRLMSNSEKNTQQDEKIQTIEAIFNAELEKIESQLDELET